MVAAMIFSSKTTLVDQTAQIGTQRLATRLNFFSLGFATAAWAPLIPYAQSRLHFNHADFGLLLLCMGIGSMLAMPATGALVQRLGSRFMIGLAVLILLTLLPSLAVLSSPVPMAVALFLFGTAAGSFGVALNLQAVIVEKNSARPSMSGFHGMCSLGGLSGVMLMTGLLAAGISPLLATLLISGLLLLIAVIALPGCLSRIEKEPENVRSQQAKPARGLPPMTILLIGMMCFIAFLSEGAAMDWSGIYLTSQYQVSTAFAGLAYTFFAITMTLGRFSGRHLLQLLGEQKIVSYSAICAAAGLLVVVTAPHWMVVLLGYALVGLGCSNIVPVMFSRVGRQNLMGKAAALSCVSTMAYSGSLMGPALIGMIGELTSLIFMFSLIALLLLVIALLNKFTQVDHA